MKNDYNSKKTTKSKNMKTIKNDFYSIVIHIIYLFILLHYFSK